MSRWAITQFQIEQDDRRILLDALFEDAATTQVVERLLAVAYDHHFVREYSSSAVVLSSTSL
jgi:hypothetical protein